MNTQTKTYEDKQTPVGEAAGRLMRAIDDQEKTIEQLRDALQTVLRPSVPQNEVCGNTAKAEAPLRSPMVEGIHMRAQQVERLTKNLQDIISRIEL